MNPDFGTRIFILQQSHSVPQQYGTLATVSHIIYKAC